MDHKKRNILFITIAGVIIILVIIALLIIKKTNYIGEPKYCNGYCYAYDGEYLAYYDIHEPDEDTVKEELKYICRVKDECQEEILEVSDNHLVIRNGDSIEIFSTDDAKIKNMDNISLKGKVFTNNRIELYFISDTYVIIGGKNGDQKREMYHLENYFGNYLEILISNDEEIANIDNEQYNTIYNVKNDELVDFTKLNVKSLKYIDTSYYDENGNVKNDSEYIISGIYIGDNEEIIINDNKAMFGNEYEVENGTLEVVDANKKYVQYTLDSTDFIYNRDTKELCFYLKDNCYKPSNDNNFKYIK